MNDMRFYVLFNSGSVISERWEVELEMLCAMELPLRVEKISPRAGIELGRLDQ